LGEAAATRFSDNHLRECHRALTSDVALTISAAGISAALTGRQGMIAMSDLSFEVQ